MKLLICTQKVDKKDPVLGFFTEWIDAFASRTQQVTVLCLQQGTVTLRQNTRIFSLGKERKKRHTFIYGIRFLRFIWRERASYDTVFVHMNHEYILLGGLVWRLLRKRIGLWYAHGHVPAGLRLAQHLAHLVFTSTSKGFRLHGKNVIVVGQGTDTALFFPRQDETSTNVLQLLTVGRIAPTKQLEVGIEAVRILRGGGQNISYTIVGAPATALDLQYEEKLKIDVLEAGLYTLVHFLGPREYRKLPKLFQVADLFVSASLNGSLDKVTIEAMASGVPVITCNDAVAEVISPYAPELVFTPGDAKTLARQILRYASLPKESRTEIKEQLRDLVVRQHSLEGLVLRILGWYNSITP